MNTTTLQQPQSEELSNTINPITEMVSITDSTTDTHVKTLLYNWKAAEAIQLYVLPMIVFLGILGNVVTCSYTLISQKRRHSPGNLYIGLLAVCDTCTLSTLGVIWLRYNYIHHSLNSKIYCQTLTFMFLTFNSISTLTVINL